MDGDTPDFSLREMRGREELEEEKKHSRVNEYVKMFTKKALSVHEIPRQPYPSVCCDTVEYRAAAALTSSTSPPPTAPVFKSSQTYIQKGKNTSTVCAILE